MVNLAHLRGVTMLIGIPKEVLPAERRVAALPETVARYVQMGFDVLIETSAGEGVFKRDVDYSAAGAEIAPDARTVYERADVVLKVKQPVGRIVRAGLIDVERGVAVAVFLEVGPVAHPVERRLYVGFFIAVDNRIAFITGIIIKAPKRMTLLKVERQCTASLGVN